MTDHFDGIDQRLVSTPMCRCGWSGANYEGRGALVEASDERNEHQLVCPDPDVRNRAIARDEHQIDPILLALGSDDSTGRASRVMPAAAGGELAATHHP